MELNWGLSVIFCILITLSLISIILLKITELRTYLIDTALISGCMAFCAAAYFTGISAFFLGILLYGFRLTDSGNILKFVILFGGSILGYLTDNNFYTYSSSLILAIFTIVRLAESIIEMTLWTPEKDEMIEV